MRTSQEFPVVGKNVAFLNDLFVALSDNWKCIPFAFKGDLYIW